MIYIIYIYYIYNDYIIHLYISYPYILYYRYIAQLLPNLAQYRGTWLPRPRPQTFQTPPSASSRLRSPGRCICSMPGTQRFFWGHWIGLYILNIILYILNIILFTIYIYILYILHIYQTLCTLLVYWAMSNRCQLIGE